MTGYYNDDTSFNPDEFNNQDNDSSPDGCMGPVICNRCGKRHGYCCEMSEDLKTLRTIKDNQMIPSSQENQQQSRRSRREGMKFLSNADLSTSPKEAKILAVKVDRDHKFGPSVVLKLSLNGETRFWTLNIKKNPNFPILENKFGNDENDWVGQKILLQLEQDEFSDQYYSRVSFPSKKEGK
jgi:hypothetical protein